MQQTKIKIFGEIKNFLKTFLCSFFEYNSCRMQRAQIISVYYIYHRKLKRTLKDGLRA